MRSLSITNGLFKLRKWIRPIYSPSTPIKNNCTENSRKIEINIGAIPKGKRCQKISSAIR